MSLFEIENAILRSVEKDIEAWMSNPLWPWCDVSLTEYISRIQSSAVRFNPADSVLAVVFHSDPAEADSSKSITSERQKRAYDILFKRGESMSDSLQRQKPEAFAGLSHKRREFTYIEQNFSDLLFPLYLLLAEHMDKTSFFELGRLLARRIEGNDRRSISLSFMTEGSDAHAHSPVFWNSLNIICCEEQVIALDSNMLTRRSALRATGLFLHLGVPIPLQESRFVVNAQINETLQELAGEAELLPKRSEPASPSDSSAASASVAVVGAVAVGAFAGASWGAAVSLAVSGVAIGTGAVVVAGTAIGVAAGAAAWMVARRLLRSEDKADSD